MADTTPDTTPDPNIAVTTDRAPAPTKVTVRKGSAGPALEGRLRVGSWDYPYRIFNGKVQYNDARDGTGEWKYAPKGSYRIQP